MRISPRRAAVAFRCGLLIAPVCLLVGGCGGGAPQPAPEPAEVDVVPAPAPSLSDGQRAAIDRITGTAGTYTEAENVYKVTFPRAEIDVVVDGWPFQPFMGITSWAAFTPAAGGDVIVMGDLTLFEDEVNPVMSVALDGGLEVTALHNHFLYDEPKVMFMHIGGRGELETLAAAVRAALDEVARIREASSEPAAGFPGPDIPPESSITAEPIDAILGVTGAASDGMYKATIGRTASMGGVEVGTQMGVNTWAAFAGSDAAAIVDGDFAMLESELQDVLLALRRAGINVVAVHNHMVGDEPRYVFLHYWGKGPAEQLARGVRAALDIVRD
jgi:hypothetical protein